VKPVFYGLPQRMSVNRVRITPAKVCGSDLPPADIGAPRSHRPEQRRGGVERRTAPGSSRAR
jgi:hypothetical protein